MTTTSSVGAEGAAGCTATCEPVTALCLPVIRTFRRSTGSTSGADNGCKGIASVDRVYSWLAMRVLSLAIGVALLLPTVADAKPRVALAPIEGDSSGAVEDMVAELLDSDYSVSGPSQVRRKIDQLGLDDKMSEKDLKKL